MWRYIITPDVQRPAPIEIAENLDQKAIRAAITKKFHVSINDRRRADGGAVCLGTAEMRVVYTRLAKHAANQKLLEKHFALEMHQGECGGFVPAPKGLAPIPGGLVPATGGVGPAPGGCAPIPGGLVPAPRGFAPAPRALAPIPGGFVPAPGSFAPALGGVAPIPGGLVPAPSTPNVAVAFWDDMVHGAQLHVPESFVQGLRTHLSSIRILFFVCVGGCGGGEVFSDIYIYIYLYGCGGLVP
jgi:hypothetical protein